MKLLTVLYLTIFSCTSFLSQTLSESAFLDLSRDRDFASQDSEILLSAEKKTTGISESRELNS